MSETKGAEIQATVAPVKNLDRKFGEVGEDEGYVRVIPEKGKPALFTPSEWRKAQERADKNPEDILDQDDALFWWQEIFN
jgi:hypothetical protein